MRVSQAFGKGYAVADPAVFHCVHRICRVVQAGENCSLASTCDKTSQCAAVLWRADERKNITGGHLCLMRALAYSLLRLDDHFLSNEALTAIWSEGLRRVLRKESAVNKPFLPVAMGLLLLLTPSLANAMSGETDITPLSNKDVLVMVQQHVPEEAIIKAINSSPCTFDTFPPVLKDMKRRGVPDAVLQAMIQAPYGPASQNVSRDDLGEQPIYHYADQLRQLGYVTPSTASRSSRGFPRANRTRAARRR
jgi:hypothetical protein